MSFLQHEFEQILKEHGLAEKLSQLDRLSNAAAPAQPPRYAARMLREYALISYRTIAMCHNTHCAQPGAKQGGRPGVGAGACGARQEKGSSAAAKRAARGYYRLSWMYNELIDDVSPVAAARREQAPEAQH